MRKYKYYLLYSKAQGSYRIGFVHRMLPMWKCFIHHWLVSGDMKAQQHIVRSWNEDASIVINGWKSPELTELESVEEARLLAKTCKAKKYSN